MNKSAFLKLIQQASPITDQQTEELEKVAAAFPYCQTAHLLLAKSAFDKGSMLSTQRLRRASSYATDRQLLKRVIYASPAPETAPEESITEEQEVLPEEVVVQEETPEAVAEVQPAIAAVAEIVTTASVHAIEPEVEVIEEAEAAYLAEAETAEPAEITEEAEEIEETEVSPGVMVFEAVELPETEEPEQVKPENHEPESEADSELALLLTINSLSSSSTDLLAPKPENKDYSSTTYLYETNEALAELSFDDQASYNDQLEALDYTTVDVAPPVEEPWAEQDDEQEARAGVSEEATESSLYEEEEKPEDAEINYTLDEIDRLYAEDPLGYWMGSSRLGEVLQLKDEYTRPRPQSFHPELILEYSKTHELEKAVQPANHSLSEQLDIIDQFLKLNPRLKTMANVKLKPEPQEDLSLKCSKIKKGMASESLANIFLNQGKVKKAIKIYEQLILKYPEKKAYFAEQIEKLQNVT